MGGEGHDIEPLIITRVWVTPKPHKIGMTIWLTLLQRNMPRTLLPPPSVVSQNGRELQYLYARLAAIQALLRALREYEHYGPHLVATRKKTA